MYIVPYAWMVNKINVQWESDWRKLKKMTKTKNIRRLERHLRHIYHDSWVWRERTKIYVDVYVDDADDDDEGDVDDNDDDERALCSENNLYANMTFF